MSLPTLLANAGGHTPLELFIAGGPIMWPILLVSFVLVTVVLERTIFLIRERTVRNPARIRQIFEKIEAGDIEGAVELGDNSKDFVARIIHSAFTHREYSLQDAFARAANREIGRYQQGIPVLDTCITAAPLLGLLGTVVGMMSTFNSLGGGDIGAKAGQITGGVGEALIAVGAGLVISIVGLVPFNILNTKVEAAKAEVGDALNTLELILKKSDFHARSDTARDLPDFAARPAPRTGAPATA